LQVLLFQGCFSGARNPHNNAYYDGFHESTAVESENIVVPESNYNETVPQNNYYYDPDHMNRNNIYGYNNAWYWRTMYRPYNHRYDSHYSFYFGYNTRPARYYGYNNYRFFDPYFDYSYNSFYYDDYYYPSYASYPRYYHGSHSNFSHNRFQSDSGTGTSQNSNAVRKFNRLRHTGSTSTVNGSNPAPYYIPLIKDVKTSGNKKRVAVRKSKNRGTTEIKSRSSSKTSTKVKSGSKKSTKIKSSSHRGRSGKSSSSRSKSSSSNNNKSSKKDSKRK